MFLPDAKAKGLSFRYVPTSVAVRIQPLAIMRIFSNLVSNAIKYTPSGKVLLGVRRRGDTVRIELHDTGPGLTPEEFETACGRGARLASALTVSDGEGYGLAIVVELARRHGYGLELLNRTGSGTSVGLTIPLAAGEGEMPYSNP
jgi:signal transduction histidine kinase